MVKCEDCVFRRGNLEFCLLRAFEYDICGEYKNGDFWKTEQDCPLFEKESSTLTSLEELMSDEYRQFLQDLNPGR